MGHFRLAERGHRDCFREAAAWGPGGDEALRRYDDNGKGRIRWAEATVDLKIRSYFIDIARMNGESIGQDK